MWIDQLSSLLVDDQVGRGVWKVVRSDDLNMAFMVVVVVVVQAENVDLARPRSVLRGRGR